MPLGDGGHEILAFGIEPLGAGQVKVFLIGQVKGSGSAFVKESLDKYLADNP